MANDFYISAGIVPIDNSTGATAMSFYISAGLVPDDTAAPGGGIVGARFMVDMWPMVELFKGANL